MDVECLNCRTGVTDVDRAACPACGSPDRAIRATDTAVGIEQRIRMQGRHGEPGEVRPYVVVTEEVAWSHDRQAHERRRMEVDRQNNRYAQTWCSLETGEITFYKEGELDDPGVHGESARRPSLPPS